VGSSGTCPATRSDRSMIRRLGAPAAAIICIAVLAAAPSAPAAQVPSTSFPVIPVRAKTGGGGFKGTLALYSFRVRRQGLVAVGRLTGTLKDRRYPSAQPIDMKGFAVPLSVAPVANAHDCARLSVRFGAAAVTVFGLRAHFPSATLVLRPHAGSPAPYHELLCGTSGAVAAQAPQSAVVHLLNAIRLLFH
jgi:hypothetical protein